MGQATTPAARGHRRARPAHVGTPNPSWLAATWLWLVGRPVPQSQDSRSFPTLGLLSAITCVWGVALLTLGPSLGAVGCSEPKEGPPPIEEGTIRGLSDADTLLFYDQRGTLLTETSGTGKVHARFNAYPYGATRHQSSSESRLYANAPRDTGVGLDHMGARFYAPDLGAWTVPDPVLVNAPEAVATAEFATANPYAYANLNPVIAVDDDGNFWHIALGAGIGAVFGGGVEAARQYAVHSSIQDWGRIGAAAAGGAVSGTVLAAAPQAGLSGFLMSNAGSSVAGGVTQRLITSGGADAGTLQDVAVDAGVGIVTGGALKGGAALLKKARPVPPPTAQANRTRVLDSEEAFKRQYAELTAGGASAGAFRATGFASQKALDSHFAKHAAEWGAGNITKAGYLKRAQSLLNTNPGGTISGHTRANGDVLRYNSVTNEFAAARADGTIKTLFRPEEGAAYWARQIAQ